MRKGTITHASAEKPQLLKDPCITTNIRQRKSGPVSGSVSRRGRLVNMIREPVCPPRGKTQFLARISKKSAFKIDKYFPFSGVLYGVFSGQGIHRSALRSCLQTRLWSSFFREDYLKNEIYLIIEEGISLELLPPQLREKETGQAIAQRGSDEAPERLPAAARRGSITRIFSAGRNIERCQTRENASSGFCATHLPGSWYEIGFDG